MLMDMPKIKHLYYVCVLKVDAVIPDFYPVAAFTPIEAANYTKDNLDDRWSYIQVRSLRNDKILYTCQNLNVK